MRRHLESIPIDLEGIVDVHRVAEPHSRHMDARLGIRPSGDAVRVVTKVILFVGVRRDSLVGREIPTRHGQAVALRSRKECDDMNAMAGQRLQRDDGGFARDLHRLELISFAEIEIRAHVVGIGTPVEFLDRIARHAVRVGQ